MHSTEESAAFRWFGETVHRGVFLLQYRRSGVQQHAVIIDERLRRVPDKAKPFVLRLSSQALRSLLGNVDRRTRIVEAREVRLYRKE